ncbi:DUF3098 domain-containing protein [Neolewinella antarctica]|uniref:DUF3098 domain-containing protein n=1 Tax=Neolewinella antarctica TaxID=442734 RepID=A0ABX0XCK9_9BACT|nr:DUF3098 domain-containing protein [Neolewinella antarctica]NJC26522.1 hypothetical protein [Neolewinella antarctica]
MAKGKKKDKQKLADPGAPIRIEPTRVAKPKVTFKEPRSSTPQVARAMTFGPDTYKWMGIGFALVMVGLFLMAGSRGDNFTEFNPEDIYSPVKITLAPAVILAGLGVVIYAILKK